MNNLTSLKKSLMKKCQVARGITILLFFIFGAFVPVLNSLILKREYPLGNGLSVKFKKPWFQNCTMYLGMIFFLIPMILRQKRKGNKEDMSLIGNFEMLKKVSGISILSILSSGLLNFTLIYLPTSVWQMFYGFQLLFATLFAITYRKHQLYLVDWLGLFITVGGMCCAGVASLLRGVARDEVEITSIFFSFIAAIIAHGFQAFQTILEEQFIHDMNVSPYQLCAFEGLWGFYLCALIVLPILSIIPRDSFIQMYEDNLESLKMLKYSWVLCVLLVSYIIVVTFFNYFSLEVIHKMSAIHRNLFDTMRPLPVWVINGFAYLITKDSSTDIEYDEYTYIEVFGFAVCVIGAFIFNRNIRFPCFFYVGDEEQLVDDVSASSNLSDLRRTLM